MMKLANNQLANLAVWFAFFAFGIHSIICKPFQLNCHDDSALAIQALAVSTFYDSIDQLFASPIHSDDDHETCSLCFNVIRKSKQLVFDVAHFTNFPSFFLDYAHDSPREFIASASFSCPIYLRLNYLLI